MIGAKVMKMYLNLLKLFTEYRRHFFPDTVYLAKSHSTLRSTHHLKIQTNVGHSVEVSFKTRHFAELRTELRFKNDQSVFKCHIVQSVQK